MALALSGGVLQSVTRNDLADPVTIGINSGAGVAITVFFLFAPLEVGNFAYAIPFIAFVGALGDVLNHLWAGLRKTHWIATDPSDPDRGGILHHALRDDDHPHLLSGTAKSGFHREMAGWIRLGSRLALCVGDFAVASLILGPFCLDQNEPDESPLHG